MITAAQFITLADKAAAAYLALRGDLTTYGAGDSTLTAVTDFGLNRKARDLQTLVLATADYDVTNSLLTATHGIQALAPYQLLVPYVMKTWINALAQHCAATALTGVTDIDTFLTYYNIGAGGAYNCLMPTEFATLYNLCLTKVMTVTNVYSPAITNMGTKSFGGAFAAGTAVTATSYAGAARIQATVTGFSGASGTLTVVGTARDATGLTQVGRTWTATVAANGTFVMAPTVATDLCLSVTDVVYPVAITGGTTVVAALVPASRTSPPV